MPVPAASPAPNDRPWVATAPEDEHAAIYQMLHARIAELSDELKRERRARAEQIQEKARIADRLRRVLDTLPAGVVVLDGRGRVQDANPAAVGLLGEPLLGVAWREVIARSVDPNSGGADVALRDGRRMVLSTCPLGDEPGQILMLQEVTAQRRMEEHLGQHRRLADMGRMAASLAHQVRTPLASALLYTGHLRNPRLPEEKRTRFAERLADSLRGLERLVDDMVAFARGGVRETESFAVADLLQRTGEDAGDELAAAGIAWRVVDEAADAVAEGNPSLLQTALRNLVTNAVQAGAREVVAVARRGPRGSVELEVRDDGPGIAPERREEVFEPFVTGRSGGTGLGLAVVRAVARAHRGEAWAEAGPGGGTRMVLRLPMVSDAGETDRPNATERVNAG